MGRGGPCHPAKKLPPFTDHPSRKSTPHTPSARTRGGSRRRCPHPGSCRPGSLTAPFRPQRRPSRWLSRCTAAGSSGGNQISTGLHHIMVCTHPRHIATHVEGLRPPVACPACLCRCGCRGSVCQVRGGGPIRQRDVTAAGRHDCQQVRAAGRSTSGVEAWSE